MKSSPVVPKRARRAWLGLLPTAITSVVLHAAGPGAHDPAQKLDPFVVTGTRTPQRLSETPIRTELITTADLELTAPRNLADAIELLPGARVENNCQNCGTSEILLLGLEQKYSHVLFDGAPLFSGLAGVYGIEQIPTLFLDRIEVVKGGGSAVYGSGAVGGVINLIGRRPTASGATAEIRYESVKGQPVTLLGGVVDYVSPDARRSFSAYGQTLRADPVDLNHDGLSDLTKKDLQVLGARYLQRAGEGELRVDYSRTVEFRRGGNKFDLPDNLADISERIDTARDAGVVVWSAPITPDFDYQASAGFAYIDRQTFYGGLFGHAPDEALTPESAPGAGDNDQAFLDRGYATHGQVAQDQFGFTKNWVYNVELQGNRRWDRHLVSFGAQYYREKIDDIVPVSPFVAEYPSEHDIATGDSAGAFVQDDWSPADGWQLVAGVRVDKSSELSKAVASPRVNIKHALSDELSLRATLGAGFRAPEAFDEDLHIELIAGDRARTVQAADLEEERSLSALLSADYAPHFADGRLAVEATAFLTQLTGTFTNSAVQTDPATGEAFRLRYNGPDAEVGGIELNIGALPWPNVRVDVGYVLQRARFDEAVLIYDDGAGGAVYERDFLETPRHYGVFQLTYREPRFVDLSVSATYTGGMKDINERTGTLNSRTRDFLVWNVSLMRRFDLPGLPAITLTVGAKNLFDSRQSDLETGVDRDPYYLYGPRTPQTYYAGVKCEF